MNNPHEQSNYAWRKIDAEWYETKQHWHDDTSEHFAKHHWWALESDTREYLAALEELLTVLRAAERATAY